jgi:myosin heavy subunit
LLSKQIYARVFDLLVAKINDCTEPSGSPIHGSDYGTISLLDIFGFESFNVNRFEQLCINYANERLQQKYVGDNFQAIKSEYESEGINVFDFSLIDNSHVMELLEGKLGLITQLNEECVKKNGEDENFVYKFNLVNSDSSSLIQNPLHRNYEFAVRHYAAPIKYDARKFIERNLDKIPADLLQCACKSTNPLIREEFQKLSSKLEAPKSGGPKKRSESTKHFVVTKFRQQLTSLMSLIEESRTRYIRCVKPNKSSVPKIMDHTHTISQLESAGLVTAIIISRESFPNRLSYELVLERFRFLSYKFDDCRLGCGDIKKDAEELLNHLLIGVSADTHSGRAKAFACGKTKVYFRAGALEMIETIRQEHYAKAAIRLQAWIRPILLKQKYQKARLGVILLQSEIRRLLASKSLAIKLQSALVMQCFFRKALASIELTRRRTNNASTIIQTRWRGMKPRVEFCDTRSKIIKVQSVARMVMAKKAVNSKRKEREEQDAMDTRMNIIQQNFDDATTVGGGSVFSVDEGLLEEVEIMFEFLRKEIVVLRKKNTKLKKELAESESDKRELFNQASGTDHALALAKIRNDQMSKTNMTLLDDNNRRRKECAKLKNELKTQQEAHESQLQDMRVEFDSALKYREVEMQSLQLHLQSLTTQHEREMDALRRDIEGKQEEHYNQIARLHDEVKSTQNTHEDYLSKLMNVLETTQRSSVLVAAPLNNNVLREKDEEIAQLKEELSRLRDTSTMNSNGGADTVAKQEAIKAMKYIVKKNREQRKQRVQDVEAIAKDVEESLASGDITGAQNFIKSLNEALHAGEKSNSRMDREMVNMIENTTSYLPGSNDDVLKLTTENEKLRRKLAKKVCKNCGHKRHKEGLDVCEEEA